MIAKKDSDICTTQMMICHWMNEMVGQIPQNPKGTLIIKLVTFKKLWNKGKIVIKEPHSSLLNSSTYTHMHIMCWTLSLKNIYFLKIYVSLALWRF